MILNGFIEGWLMAGWNLRNGTIKKAYLSEDEIWSLFNYVFSDSCMKRNTYKPNDKFLEKVYLITEELAED